MCSVDNLSLRVPTLADGSQRRNVFVQSRILTIFVKDKKKVEKREKAILRLIYCSNPADIYTPYPNAIKGLKVKEILSERQTFAWF